MDADRLLNGPRGRGLLFALAESQELSELASRARMAAQPPGTAAFSFGWFESEEDPNATEEERLARQRAAAEELRREYSRPVAPADMASAIRAATPATRPDAAALIAALSSTVDDARPWQSADGIEPLLAQPEVVEALRPIARLMAAAPWDASLATPQWRLAFDGTRDVPTRPPAELLAEESQRSSAWWSAPHSELPRSTGSLPGFEAVPAGLVLIEDAFGATSAEVAELMPPSLNVFEIATADDFARLAADFPSPVGEQQHEAWTSNTGREGPWVVPDWPAIAKQWDGVHLTIAAYLEGATRAIDLGDGTATMIAGWSPDETRWFVPATASGTVVTWRHTHQLGWRPVT